jgi:hypothetical protein
MGKRIPVTGSLEFGLIPSMPPSFTPVKPHLELINISTVRRT